MKTLTTVSMYNEQGWLYDLAPLNIGRYGHACTAFYTSDGVTDLKVRL